MDQNIKDELNSASDMEAFLLIVGKYYNLKEAKLNFISKPILINNISKVLSLINAKKK